MKSIFDHTCSYQKAKLVLLGAPFEATVSYGEGAADGPLWIQKASSQLDFFNPDLKKDYSKEGIHFHYLSRLKKKSELLRPLVKKYTAKKHLKKESPALLKKINTGCGEMAGEIQKQTKKILDENKLFGLIGGDHSVSEGALVEMARRCKNNFGLLHFDAHADMRLSYQGFKHSHASVMRNVLCKKNRPQITVQWGVRDLCSEEYEFISHRPDIKCFFDFEIKKKLLEGASFSELIRPAVQALPQNIYISFDVDALDGPYAPSTGCPVPGGLSFDQALYFFRTLREAKKKIIGFDVVETGRPKSPHASQWDGNVSARLIYALCGLMLYPKK